MKVGPQMIITVISKEPGMNAEQYNSAATTETTAHSTRPLFIEVHAPEPRQRVGKTWQQSGREKLN